MKDTARLEPRDRSGARRPPPASNGPRNRMCSAACRKQRRI